MELFAVELRVRDWPGAVAWYRDRFGLTLSLLDEEGRYALFAEGVALKAGEPTKARLLFRVDDLDATVSKLLGRGLSPESQAVSDAEAYRSASFHDADRHELVVFAWDAG